MIILYLRIQITFCRSILISRRILSTNIFPGFKIFIILHTVVIELILLPTTNFSFHANSSILCICFPKLHHSASQNITMYSTELQNFSLWFFSTQSIPPEADSRVIGVWVLTVRRLTCCAAVVGLVPPPRDPVRLHDS